MYYCTKVYNIFIEMTLRLKIFFYFILPILLSVALLSTYNSRQELAQQEELTNSSFIASTQNATFAISKNSTSAITLLEVSAEVLCNTLFGKRAESVSYLNSILNGFNDFYSINLSYEINADGNDEATYNSLLELQLDPNKLSADFYDAYDFRNNNMLENIDDWVSNTENGRFMLKLKKHTSSISIDPPSGIETREHYASIKNRYSSLGEKFVFVSEPSYENVNLYVEYIYPLVYEDRFVGELAFSRNLYYIFNTLKSFLKVDSSQMFLLNNTDKIVANTLDMNISTASIDDLYLDAENKFNTSFLEYKNGKLMRDERIAQQTSFNSYSPIYRDILRIVSRGDYEPNTIIEYMDSKTKKSYILSYTLLEELDWILVQIVPKEKLYIFKERAKSNAILELSIALACFFIMCFLFSYYTKRLRNTTQSVENIYDGKLHLQIPEIKQSKDESVKLINAVALLSSKVSSIVLHSKTANTQLIDTAEKLTVVSNDYEQSTKHFDSYIGEISRSLGQITDISKNIKDSIEDLSKSIKQSSLLAKEENALAHASFKTIESLRENATDLLGRVNLIKDRGNNALHCLNQISKVTSQAKLLSINTSIEAKKSKEKGNVLSKISKDIYMFANITKEYTKEIALIIRDLLESSFVAIDQTLKLQEQIDFLKEDFSKLISGTENTSLSIDNILPEVHRINDSMSSQNLRKAQLKETIGLLDNNSKQAGALYRQFVDLRRELNFVIEQITHEIAKFSSKY